MIELIKFNPNLIPSIIAICGDLYAFIRWIDERRLRLQDRKRTYKNERLKAYNNLLRTLSGVSENGKRATLSEQVCSAWLLLEYSEYDKITLSIFKDSQLIKEADEEWKKIALPPLETVLTEIQDRQG